MKSSVGKYVLAVAIILLALAQIVDTAADLFIANQSYEQNERFFQYDQEQLANHTH